LDLNVLTVADGIPQLTKALKDDRVAAEQNLQRNWSTYVDACHWRSALSRRSSALTWSDCIQPIAETANAPRASCRPQWIGY
jgi:hypothetical protein